MKDSILVKYCLDCCSFRDGFYTCKLGYSQDKKLLCRKKNQFGKPNKILRKKIPWDKIEKAINKKYRRVKPYTKAYLYAVWKGWSTNYAIKDDLKRLIK